MCVCVNVPVTDVSDAHRWIAATVRQSVVEFAKQTPRSLMEIHVVHRRLWFVLDRERVNPLLAIPLAFGGDVEEHVVE